MEGAARWPHSRARTAPSPPCPLASSPPLLPAASPSHRCVPPPGQAAAFVGVTRRGDGRKSGRKGAGLVSHRAQSPLSALFSRDFAGFRPQEPPESAPPRASGRRRTVSESSCVALMHAASLTKGYRGNPPSGRSVSPPTDRPVFSCPLSGPPPDAAPPPSAGRCPAALRRTLPRRFPPDAAQPPAASRQPPAASRPARFPPAQRPTPSVPRRSSGSRPPDRRAAVTAQTACRHSTADKSASARTLGTPAPAGVRFASGDRHTGRGRPRPRPGRLPRDAAGCRACPIRTEGLTIT